MGTTYFSSVKGAWESFDIVSCGPRCGLINVTQIWNTGDLHQGYNPYLYLCQSTVHEVQGAVIQEEKLTNEKALVAATSLSQGVDALNETTWNTYLAK